MTTGRRARAPALTLLAGTVMAVALLLGGCATADAGAGARPAAAPAAPAENPLSAGRLQDPRIDAGDRAPTTSAQPTRVRIPSIGVDSALESLGIGEGGRLNAPADYGVAGWYAGGVVPGAIGPAIIAGHIDSPTAPAVFARLSELAPGAEVLVTMSDGAELAFQITGSTQSPKADFPTAEVYSNVPTPELRLITCAGGFDAGIGHYSDNLIVFAEMSD